MSLTAEQPRRHSTRVETTSLVLNKPFRTLDAEFMHALRKGGAPLQQMLEELVRAVTEVIARSDVAAIAGLRTRLERLRPRLGEGKITREDKRTSEVVLRTLSLQLADARTQALMKNAADARDAEDATLRERIYTLLTREALRPGQIAERLACDPSQVSRVLHDLREVEEVVIDQDPTGISDGRARRYRARWQVRPTIVFEIVGLDERSRVTIDNETAEAISSLALVGRVRGEDRRYDLREVTSPSAR